MNGLADGSDQKLSRRLERCLLPELYVSLLKIDYSRDSTKSPDPWIRLLNSVLENDGSRGLKNIGFQDIANLCQDLAVEIGERGTLALMKINEGDIRVLCNKIMIYAKDPSALLKRFQSEKFLVYTLSSRLVSDSPAKIYIVNEYFDSKYRLYLIKCRYLKLATEEIEEFIKRGIHVTHRDLGVYRFSCTNLDDLRNDPAVTKVINAAESVFIEKAELLFSRLDTQRSEFSSEIDGACSIFIEADISYEKLRVTCRDYLNQKHLLDKFYISHHQDKARILSLLLCPKINISECFSKTANVIVENMMLKFAFFLTQDLHVEPDSAKLLVNDQVPDQSMDDALKEVMLLTGGHIKQVKKMNHKEYKKIKQKRKKNPPTMLDLVESQESSQEGACSSINLL